MSISFVDYYQSNGISPVRQDISDIKMHFQRRANLFKVLGLSPQLFKNRTIAEFGPGSGHNSIFKASLSPKKYVIIDGNQVGLRETVEMLKQYPDINIEPHLCLFQDFKTEERFDLVWAEGCIPHQQDPVGIARAISEFVQPDGLLVVSCVSGLSYLSEIMRRIVFMRSIEGQNLTVSQKLAHIKPLMTSHLLTLENMSRLVDDWILDNIIQPFGDAKLFTIPTAIHTLKDRFDVYNTSPNLIRDWRWYKDIIGADPGFNSVCLESYYSSNINLIDRRISGATHSVEFGKQIEDAGERAWEMMQQYEKGSYGAYKDIRKILEEISKMVSEFAPDTAASIAVALQHCDRGDIKPSDNAFKLWWGRGQQYASFIKNRH